MTGWRSILISDGAASWKNTPRHSGFRAFARRANSAARTRNEGERPALAPRTGRLGRHDCAEVLGKNLKEEKGADKKLTSLAESKVNLRAARAFSSEVDTGSREENAIKQTDRAAVLIPSEPKRLELTVDGSLGAFRL
jgi:hypothetical protein